MIRQPSRPIASSVSLGDRIAREIRGLRLVRLDLQGVDLEPGAALTLVLRSGKAERPFTVVGDDPRPPRPPTISLPASLPAVSEQDDYIVLSIAGEPAAIQDGISIVPVYSGNHWSDYLPAVFRQDQRQAGLLSRYLDQLFIEGERIETVLDGFVDNLTPTRLPSEAAARYLAAWFDIDLEAVRDLGSEDETAKRLALSRARTFLARVLPHALNTGTVAAFLAWVDAVAEARGMCDERRREIAVVEGFKMRRLFTLPRNPGRDDPEPTELQHSWGRLPRSAPLASDPLARRAYLDEGGTLDTVTLGLPGEDEDPVPLARLLGGRLWLFVPAPKGAEPTNEEWSRLLAPVLPAHLKLEVSDKPPEFKLGQNTVLGVSTRFPH